jgi:hypothetical protein
MDNNNPQNENNIKGKIKNVAVKVGEYGIFPKTASAMIKFPFFLIVVILYCGLSYAFDIWHPLWIIFLTIPIYYRIATACKAKTKKAFLNLLPVPECVVTLYLILSFATGAWKITWILFLIIPTFYWIVSFSKPNQE